MISCSTIGWTWIAVEGLFAAVFYGYLVRRANERTEPSDYRDCGRNRHILLDRIVTRIENTAKSTGEPVERVLSEFLKEWFAQSPQGPPPLCRAVESSLSSSSEQSSINSEDDEDEVDIKKQWTIPGLMRNEMNDFLAWAFFGKEYRHLLRWEEEEHERLFQILENRTGLVFLPGRGNQFVPRRLNLESMAPLHRPLLLYFVFGCFQAGTYILLKFLGYQRVASNSGVKGWYRPARNDGTSLLPSCFFHGIAPGGLTFYLPMILLGLFRDERAVLLFQNSNISCSIGFKALSEEATVAGVTEIVHRFLGRDCPIRCVGHSFGSCPLTWLVHSNLRDRIHQLVLIDPVSVLLSEPDVMVNFLYSQEMSLIRMIASSELFTEYYLRRHFAWYNSELWLEDVPKTCRVVIALAEKDEIVRAGKVRHHVQEVLGRADIDVLFWEGSRHAECVTSPSKWRQLRLAMLQQEHALARTE